MKNTFRHSHTVYPPEGASAPTYSGQLAIELSSTVEIPDTGTTGGAFRYESAVTEALHTGNTPTYLGPALTGLHSYALVIEKTGPTPSGTLSIDAPILGIFFEDKDLSVYEDLQLYPLGPVAHYTSSDRAPQGTGDDIPIHTITLTSPVDIKIHWYVSGTYL